MSTSANVHSSDAIEAVRTALLVFAERAADAITALELEMQRVVEWVEHDRPRHWKNQHRVASDELTVAKAALHRCLMFPKTLNERPACHEERQAVKKAQARLEYCERKAERVLHWKRVLPHEISEYKGRISRLKRLVEFEVPQAIGVLNNILLRLEEYNAVRVAPAEKAYNEVALLRELWPEKPPTGGVTEGTEIVDGGTEADVVKLPSELDSAEEVGHSAVEQNTPASAE
jgi:hypothetical protein